jgi:enoyl-CoA hydratase/carnithine racemase
VSVPTLIGKVGPAATRSLLLEGRVITGREAVALGLADQLAKSRVELDEMTEARCRSLAMKPPNALKITKSWLNELESSEDNSALDGALERSLGTARHPEAAAMLEENWFRKGR